jgi:hypothetical protein
MRKSLDCFESSKYFSLKQTTYFSTYDRLLGPYQDREVTFVEVGVLSGGSLHMWRQFFGPKARIIGVDLNPEAKRWEADGFEVFIGNQQSRVFWEGFYRQVGPIDILLDDGGHTYAQQIVTTQEAMRHMSKGLVIVEDTCTSYMPSFGFPSQYTFTEWAKGLVDPVNARNEGVAVLPNENSSKIEYLSFFTSIIAIHIDEGTCLPTSIIVNTGEHLPSTDFRHSEDGLGWIQSRSKAWRKRFRMPAWVVQMAPIRIFILSLQRWVQRREAKRAIRG